MEPGQVRQRFRSDEIEDVTSSYMEKQSRYRSGVSMSQLPLYSVVIVAFIGAGLLGLAYLSTEALPEPLYLKDAYSYNDKFIAERARSHLEKLTSMGPKPVGSYENEVLAVDFLTREISFIMQRANPYKRISYDLQKSTGSYLLQFQPYGFVNYYSDIQNIVVKLSSSLNSSSSLLINCHFDSVPTSPGASDDGLNCAVMLEVLEVLSHSNKSLKHNVIFLFNGAEESPLQGSHGFITQHEWANEVKAFINLEACGAGGREVLFQAGPNHPWLVQLYAESVPRPHGVVLAEEIFQSGLIPSDTDFRVFRDFGEIPGLDFAHAMNGYVYHTRYDDLAAIPLGTFQHTGDNLLALVQKLASSEELTDTSSYAEGQSVYYDLFGLFMARYSKNIGTLLNVSTVILAIFGAWRDVHFLGKVGRPMETFKLLALNAGVLLLGWITSVVSVLLVATLLDFTNSSMSWFTRTYFVFGLYYCPVLYFSMLFPYMLCKYWAIKKLPQEFVLQGRVYVNAVQLFWAVALLVGTVVGIRSSFVFMILLLLPSLTNIALSLSPWREKSYHWLAAFLSSTLLPVLFILYNTLLTFGLFIPITGRIGPTKNPDAIIGVFAALLCILSTSYVTPLVIIVRNAWKFLTSVAVLHLISLAIVIFSPLGFPYSGNPSAPTPQRIHVYHVGRIFHDASGHTKHQDSGFWLVNLDRHSPNSVRSLIPDVSNAQKVDMTHGKELMCAYPLFSPRVLTICNQNHWIPSVPPVVHSPASLEVKSVMNISQTVRRLSIRVSGPDHMGLVLAPYDGCIILNWSFNADVASSVISVGEQQIYYITYAHGLSAQPWNFWIEFQVPQQELPYTLDIAVSAQYIHEKLSEDFLKFIRMYPDWTHVTAYTATYTAWQI